MAVSILEERQVTRLRSRLSFRARYELAYREFRRDGCSPDASLSCYAAGASYRARKSAPELSEAFKQHSRTVPHSRKRLDLMLTYTTRYRKQRLSLYALDTLKETI